MKLHLYSLILVGLIILAVACSDREEKNIGGGTVDTNTIALDSVLVVEKDSNGTKIEYYDIKFNSTPTPYLDTTIQQRGSCNIEYYWDQNGIRAITRIIFASDEALKFASDAKTAIIPRDDKYVVLQKDVFYAANFEYSELRMDSLVASCIDAGGSPVALSSSPMLSSVFSCETEEPSSLHIRSELTRYASGYKEQFYSLVKLYSPENVETEEPEEPNNPDNEDTELAEGECSPMGTMECCKIDGDLVCGHLENELAEGECGAFASDNYQCCLIDGNLACSRFEE